MQDGAAWLTHLQWNANAAAPGCTVRCSDGYVAVDAPAQDVMRAFGSDATLNGTILDAPKLARESTMTKIVKAGFACAPVLRVSEVVVHPQTTSRELIVSGKSADGAEWPLLACPIRLSATPALMKRAIGKLGADNESVFEQWRRAASAPPGQSAA